MTPKTRWARVTTDDWWRGASFGLCVRVLELLSVAFPSVVYENNENLKVRSLS